MEAYHKLKSKTVLRIINADESRITSLVPLGAIPFEFFISTDYNFCIHRWPLDSEILESIHQHKERKHSELQISCLILVPVDITLELIYSPPKQKITMSSNNDSRIVRITCSINI